VASCVVSGEGPGGERVLFGAASGPVPRDGLDEGARTSTLYAAPIRSVVGFVDAIIPPREMAVRICRSRR